MRYRILPGRSRIECQARATLHGLTATTDRVTGAIEVADDLSELTRLAVEVDARSLNAGDFLRNHQMHDHLETGRNPTARLELERPAPIVAGRVAFAARLTYRGRAVRYELEAAGRREGAGLRGACTFQPRFTEYGMQPPKLLFLKMEDPVEVRVVLEAVREEP